MNRLLPALLATIIMLLTPAMAALSQEEAPSVTQTPLRGALHVLQGRGGNVLASVGEDGILLVDDDYPQYAPAYGDALAQLDRSGRQPRFVLNTHWHGDHTGGNAFWAERGAVVLAHINVRKRMATRQEMKAMGRVVEPSPKKALPVVTFGHSLALHFNGDVIEVQHFPEGHTDGDSVVFFTAENVVHMGDLMWKDRFPFVDVGSGGNVFSLIANIERILPRIDEQTTIVAGHGGPLADKADLERYLAMLRTTSNLVREQLAQGQSLDAITAQGLGDEWASWGEHYIEEAAWISFIAASL